MSRDRALAAAVAAGCAAGMLITIISGFGPGSVFGAVQATALLYLGFARR